VGQASRREPLSRGRIAAAALALADRDGPDAVTMRRLGRELGVEGMALYVYFASKDELLGAVAALVLDELQLEPRRTGPWQERVRHVLRSWAELQDRHPGGFQLLYGRRDWVPQDAAPIEEILAALRDAGLPPDRSLLAYQTLVLLLDGVLLARYGEDSLAGAWRAGAARADAGAFPRYAEAAPHGAELTVRGVFDFGVELLVRGLEHLIRDGR
jgi:AcrR family transcriptional regulator